MENKIRQDVFHYFDHNGVEKIGIGPPAIRKEILKNAKQLIEILQIVISKKWYKKIHNLSKKELVRTLFATLKENELYSINPC